jgi:hypothetical protein
MEIEQLLTRYCHAIDEQVTPGTGNVFADLGITDADERQGRLRLA